MTLDGGSNLMMENKQLDKPPWWTGSKGETGLVCSYIQHLEAVILGCFSQISSSINQRSLSFVSRWRWKSIPTWPKSQPVSKWHYIYIYIYILRERERDNVSGNNNHRKSHQKTPHSYLSCQHQVGQWLSDHDALQSVTGELMGEWYQVESQGQETHLKIQ